MKRAKVGEALNNLMESEGLTNDQMAFDLHVDATMISKMRNNKRNMQSHVASKSIEIYDNEYYTMEATREFTDGRTAPRINGDGIEHDNRLAILLKTKEEIKEALATLNIELFLKRPDLATEQELMEIDVFIKELKESVWWSHNLIAALSEAYNRSSKKINEELTRKWKSSLMIR
ncbi:hypothetical protein [Virgibacillus dokdonensis]|uniref:Uncharacterized protein n=1 Tax=Virgibacillus dokdonensis TaxID=302167 RepID=A0ABU7VHE7_9BACI